MILNYQKINSEYSVSLSAMFKGQNYITSTFPTQIYQAFDSLSQFYSTETDDPNTPMYYPVGFNSYYSYYRSHNSTVPVNLPKCARVTFKAVQTENLFSYLDSFTPDELVFESFNNFYPIALRYTNGKNIYVIERPPFKANITFRKTRSNSTSEKYFEYSLWVPWTVMILDMNPKTSNYTSYLYFNDGPLNSLDDIIVPCFYPNMYDDGRMCLNQTINGLQQYLYETQCFDPATVYNYILNDYMSGGWNIDLGINVFDISARRSQYADKIRQEFYKSNRYSTANYVNSFLKSFSNLDLQNINQIVTELKNARFSAYSPLHKEFIKNAQYPTLRNILKTNLADSNNSFPELEEAIDKSLGFSINKDQPIKYITITDLIYFDGSLANKIDAILNSTESGKPVSEDILQELSEVLKSLCDYYINNKNDQIQQLIKSNSDFVVYEQSDDFYLFVESADNIYPVSSKDVNHYIGLFRSPQLALAETGI